MAAILNTVHTTATPGHELPSPLLRAELLSRAKLTLAEARALLGVLDQAERTSGLAVPLPPLGRSAPAVQLSKPNPIGEFEI